MNGGRLYDTPDGAEVLAREIGKHLWSGGFHEQKFGCILITNESIMHKDITDFDGQFLTLSSRNKAFEEFKIEVNNVYQIFNVIKRMM